MAIATTHHGEVSKMFWLRRLNKKSPPESQPTENMAEELSEARSIRERIKSQAPIVSNTFSMLADARQHEQFTDEIDASFTRRHR
jgi:hypothetical protein